MKTLTLASIVALVLLAGAYQVQADDPEDRRNTQLDQATGVKYSLLGDTHPIFKPKERVADACKASDHGRGSRVMGEVPDQTDLSDQATAKLLIEKGLQYLQTQCGKNAEGSIGLFQNSFVDKNRKRGDGNGLVVQGSYGFGNLRIGSNRAYDAKISARIEREKAKTEANWAAERANLAARDAAELKVQQDKERQKKQEIAGMRESFVKKNGVQAWPAADALVANPFVSQGKTVAVISRFEEMSSATDGLFMVGGNPVFVSDIPNGLFTSKRWVILAGSVVGKKEIQLPMAGKMAVTHLKYVGGFNCPDQECNGIGHK